MELQIPNADFLFLLLLSVTISLPGRSGSPSVSESIHSTSPPHSSGPGLRSAAKVSPKLRRPRPDRRDEQGSREQTTHRCEIRSLCRQKTLVKCRETKGDFPPFYLLT